MPPHLIKLVVIVGGFVLPAWTLYRLRVIANRKAKGVGTNLNYEVVLGLFITYLSIMVQLTIVPAYFSVFDNHGKPKLNLVPVIHTYRQLVDSLSAPGRATRYSLENIFGNIILFIPFGVLAPLIFPGLRTMKKLAAVSSVLSFIIELIQFFLKKIGTNRTADIDDILLNTLGGIIGWLVFSAWISRRKERRNREPV